ncbi:hypothetical protein SNEBB_010793 [Seison nebaliae]|nr:hypothetical protein SNEBB_010793 [Seison nebaliae]
MIGMIRAIEETIGKKKEWEPVVFVWEKKEFKEDSNNDISPEIESEITSDMHIINLKNELKCQTKLRVKNVGTKSKVRLFSSFCLGKVYSDMIGMKGIQRPFMVIIILIIVSFLAILYKYLGIVRLNRQCLLSNTQWNLKCRQYLIDLDNEKLKNEQLNSQIQMTKDEINSAKNQLQSKSNEVRLLQESLDATKSELKSLQQTKVDHENCMKSIDTCNQQTENLQKQIADDEQKQLKMLELIVKRMLTDKFRQDVLHDGLSKPLKQVFADQITNEEMKYMSLLGLLKESDEMLWQESIEEECKKTQKSSLKKLVHNQHRPEEKLQENVQIQQAQHKSEHKREEEVKETDKMGDRTKMEKPDVVHKVQERASDNLTKANDDDIHQQQQLEKDFPDMSNDRHPSKVVEESETRRKFDAYDEEERKNVVGQKVN